ncbi:phage tail tape measure protein [Ruminococcus champanellensis]|uniref:phage tail tape measure protein n=1 Tax=Ruminococcus champanellensis TaxID=1161942 RepID=UPI0023F56E23|nr:phage tail tape measure protein [Ruminococcus champanellensis]
MPNNDGEVIFDVRANLEKLPKDLNDAKTSTKKAAEQMESDITDSMEHAAKETKISTGKITDAMEDVETGAVSAGKAVEKIDADPLDTLGEQSVETGESLQQVADSAESASGQINQVADSSSKATGMMGKLSSVASGIGKGLGTVASAGAAVASAVGGAAVATGAFAVNSAVDMDKAVNSLRASIDATDKGAEHYRGVMKEIYADNYGEDFQDIADAISLINRNIGDISGDQLKDLSESAFVLRDTFQYDIAESTRAAKAMMNSFGISGEEAMDMIALGAQNGLDYSGEMIDSINEYSVQFAKLGFTAEDMFQIMQEGAWTGAWNLDKVGDAIKEFSIRAIDGSESTAEGFTSLGLNADKMAKKFGQGGESAKKAFQETLTALSGIEDPLKQNTIGVQLFGTMWEDLGPDVVTQLNNIGDNADWAAGKMDELKKVKYDDLGSMFDGLKRSVEMLVLPLGEELIPLLSDLIQDALPVIEDVLPDVIDLFGEFLEPVLGLAKEALPALTDLLTMLMDTTLKQLSEDLLPVLKDAFTTLKEPLEKLITEALPPLISLFTSIMPLIADLAATLLPPLIDVFLALLPPITDLIESLLPPLISLFESIAPILEDLAPIIGLVAEGIGKTLSEAIELVMPIIENIIEILGDLIGFISDVFTGDWESAWDHLVDYVKAVLNWIPITAETVINKFIDLINKMIKGVNKITGVIGIEAISEIDHVTLPRFHTGGVVDFKGKYEDTIIAKDGEMVLTEAQQKRLFDIANGFEYPTGSGGSGQVINQYTTESTEIINNNEFHVRDDQDIERIGEELAALQSRNDAGRGQ